jgi:uncharacterized protein
LPPKARIATAEPLRDLGRTSAAAPQSTMDEGLRAYMRGVYLLMMLGVAMSGAITLYLISNQPLLKALASHPLFFAVIFFGTLGLSWCSNAIIASRSVVVGHIFFWTYAALWGAGLAPMIGYLASVGAVSVVAKAFFIAAGLFGGASLYGYTTKKDLSGLGYFLCLLTFGLLLATIINLVIFKTSLFGLALSYVTVIVFTAVTAWETQMIKDMYLKADDDQHRESMVIFGAFQLYGSFMMIFSRMIQVCWSLYDEVS